MRIPIRIKRPVWRLPEKEVSAENCPALYVCIKEPPIAIKFATYFNAMNPFNLEQVVDTGFSNNRHEEKKRLRDTISANTHFIMIPTHLPRDYTSWFDQNKKICFTFPLKYAYSFSLSCLRGDASVRPVGSRQRGDSRKGNTRQGKACVSNGEKGVVPNNKTLFRRMQRFSLVSRHNCADYSRCSFTPG